MQAVGDFRTLAIKNFYSAPGREILNDFVKPVLGQSISYDRLTGYFSVNALVSVAEGLEHLFRQNGKMRLVIGIHDVPLDLVAAWTMGNLLPAELVQEYKNRLLNEVGYLVEQVERNAITTIGWMMKLNLLEVKVAAPRNALGIYHQKRMIFRDSNRNVIAGTGSLNETKGGQENIEEMHFNFSWNADPSMIEPLTTSFEKIWSGQEESVEIHDLDDSFATSLLKKLGNPGNPLKGNNPEITPTQEIAEEILRLAIDSPIFAPNNISSAALYPHQERVYSESLNRWPVRVLMADEVGLGKTLEAGAVISYMHHIQKISRITILAPAGLLSQWQDEMTKHFGLEFWKWNSGLKSFTSQGNTWNRSNGFGGPTGPQLQLVSAQWARQNADQFAQSLPDMLFVDEAHAARVQIDNYGNHKATLLWRLLDRIKHDVPHIVLMTATPMQIHPAEYHSLLKILGLPSPWDGFGMYEKSLKIIAKTNPRPTFQDAADVATLVLSTFQNNEWLPKILSESEFEFILKLVGLAEAAPFDRANLVLKNFDEYRRILMKIHPANFLTCRNTKSGLEEFGYKFPARKFTAPSVAMTPAHTRFETHLEAYLSNGYGRSEMAIRPDSTFPIGFAKSTYYQRLVSSLFAAHKSLTRRRDKLKLIRDELLSGNFEAINQYFNLLADDDDDGLDEGYERLDGFVIEKPKLLQILDHVKYEIALEVQTLSDLVKELDAIGEDLSASDPKFIEAISQLGEKVQIGPVLVFSRYTDTLEGFLEYFKKSDLASDIDGYSLYTGGDVWICQKGVITPATKNDVTDALEDGRITIVFCSDAASEGLNLQSAQAIINLDVPWNPARLEQRIGRIARLGQKAEEVEIVNLWYPRSVEAQMYRRLLQRRDEYQIAVGEFPEIFGSAIKAAVADRLSNTGTSTDPLAELNAMRNHFQRVALEEVWQRGALDLPPSKAFREDLLSFIGAASIKQPADFERLVFTAEVGRRGSLTLTSPALLAASKIHMDTEIDTDWLELGVFENEISPLMFGVRISGSTFRLLKTNSLGALLLAAIGTESLKNSHFATAEFGQDKLEWALEEAINSEYLVPKHLSGITTKNLTIRPFLQFSVTGAQFRSLGRVRGEKIEG
jgi:superfamily II DNA or RNA helicase